MPSHRDILAGFDITTIPTLDVVVLAALELFSEVELTPLQFPHLRPLVLGSVNAASTGRIIFSHNEQVGFADESSFQGCLDNEIIYDSVVVLSASGKKHAVAMVEAGVAAGVETFLVTNNHEAPAAKSLPAERVFLYPKNREPYTYNTSTYLGPIFASTGENPQLVFDYLEARVKPLLLRNFENYSAVTFIIPTRFRHIRAMIRTKFDELFGPYITGRIFTEEEIKHAKTVVTSGEELFISLGVENNFYGLAKNRLSIPLLNETDYGAILAVSYFIVGKIQTAHPPYFQKNIEAYCKTTSQIFGQEIKPIVE